MAAFKPATAPVRLLIACLAAAWPDPALATDCGGATGGLTSVGSLSFGGLSLNVPHDTGAFTASVKTQANTLIYRAVGNHITDRVSCVDVSAHPQLTMARLYVSSPSGDSQIAYLAGTIKGSAAKIVYGSVAAASHETGFTATSTATSTQTSTAAPPACSGFELGGTEFAFDDDDGVSTKSFVASVVDKAEVFFFLESPRLVMSINCTYMTFTADRIVVHLVVDGSGLLLTEMRRAADMLRRKVRAPNARLSACARPQRLSTSVHPYALPARVRAARVIGLPPPLSPAHPRPGQGCVCRPSSPPPLPLRAEG